MVVIFLARAAWAAAQTFAALPELLIAWRTVSFAMKRLGNR